MKTVLMVAFQFPPFAGSSAVQRTLRFVRYLPEFGWRPLVLTAHPRAYEQTSDDQLGDVPVETVVERAFCLDTARHLGVRRRYLAALARPDRWISWWPAAMVTGLRMIRRYRPDVLWSTFPVPTAHVIAHSLQQRSNLPWVADFRDPMVQPNDPDDPALWRSYERVERATIAAAQLNLFTTEGTQLLYRARYPERPETAFGVIENGYDDDVFESDAGTDLRAARDDGSLLLVHSGAIYPLERDPTQLFWALRDLTSTNTLSSSLRIRLRATGHDADIASMIRSTRVETIVELAPPIAYREAIAEMRACDGLLVLQAGAVNTQVPAKVYEYLRAGRPILGLTDPSGDTARVLRRAGVQHIARIDSREDIVRVLRDFIAAIRGRTVGAPDAAYVRGASRRNRTRELAARLDAVAAERGRLPRPA
jgi:hypothetical protein